MVRMDIFLAVSKDFARTFFLDDFYNLLVKMKTLIFFVDVLIFETKNNLFTAEEFSGLNRFFSPYSFDFFIFKPGVRLFT